MVVVFSGKWGSNGEKEIKIANEVLMERKRLRRQGDGVVGFPESILISSSRL
jgi:hypothetical protein